MHSFGRGVSPVQFRVRAPVIYEFCSAGASCAGGGGFYAARQPTQQERLRCTARVVQPKRHDVESVASAGATAIREANVSFWGKLTCRAWEAHPAASTNCGVEAT